VKILRIAAAGAVLAAAIAAPASAADEARVRVLHASPDAPNVDVHLDGALVDALTNVPFGTISDYLTIPAGSHQVQVYATGTTESPVIDAELDFETGSATTVAATNAVAEIEAQVLVDAPAADADGAQVRVVHFSADAPAIDVAPDGADPGDAIVKNLAYPNPTDYLVVPADTYDLEVRLAGEPTVALKLDPVDVEAGMAYSVFAIGSAADPAVGDNGLRVMVAADAMAVPSSDGSMATPPPTSTVDAPTRAPTGSPLVPAGLVLLLAAGVTAVALRRRLADSRR
jgi:hypothetical protein